MEYLIDILQFSGPFDLLFHLIEKNEIDLNNLPISDITTQYIDHLNTLVHVDMDHLSEFMLLAATLLEIKSKTLLPGTDGAGDDSEEDPRADLVRRLLEYKKFRELAHYLDEREQAHCKSVYRKHLPENILAVPVELHKEVEFEFSEKALLKALSRLLSSLDAEDLERKRYFKKVGRDKWTVEEKISHLRVFFRQHVSAPFEKLFLADTTKGEIIATFLALLELIRTGEVKVRQSGLFDTILITRIEGGDPRP